MASNNVTEPNQDTSGSSPTPLPLSPPPYSSPPSSTANIDHSSPTASAPPPPYPAHGHAHFEKPPTASPGAMQQQPPLPPLPVYPMQPPGVYAYYPPGAPTPPTANQFHQGYQDGGGIYYVANREVCQHCGHDGIVEELNMCLLLLLLLLVICFFPIGIIYLLLLPSIRERRCARCGVSTSPV